MSGLIRNSSYTWDLVAFKVEDELYRVPKTHFVNNPNPPFRDMFSLPPVRAADGTTCPVEGESDENPIVLPHIKKVDFERFLSVLYPRFPTSCYDSFETATWLSVLKLATFWNFLPLRKLAIHFLSERDDFDNFDRIVAGRQYSVLKMFKEGVVNVGCEKDADIPLGEGEQVGLKTSLELYQFKGKMRRALDAPSVGDIFLQVEACLMEIFGEEIRDITAKNKAMDEMALENGDYSEEMKTLFDSYPEIRLQEVRDVDGLYNAGYSL
ncbi:hypothetical protein PM082_021862 [Marasmius tenuissimus]|nr:hypothetical protein PM082_021862 [Marasmius tenuissimus]